MSEFIERISQLSPKRLTLLAMELQARLEAAERDRHEPVAIIGMGCRFPGGVDSPAAFWRLLCDGGDAIVEVPPSRWDGAALYDADPDTPGRAASRWGGFIEPIDTFEPQLFGISPREAQRMDPQQRLLLEVAWEALEQAGLAPDRLSGSATGVFVGICNGDYGQRLLGGSLEQIDAYLSTGNAHSIASGRLSYVLGLQGPSLSVDTACSSSLVAVHLAVQSLRAGECRLALAGGVNAVLTPMTTVALSRARMMAGDGRCKAFDARADGFVRAEGCGLVVLKRLREAQADGDPILAIIRGSAVNQDGRSNGLTAPNGPAQVAVIRAALADAGLAPAQVQYVEAHGTGTALGDPIEVQALGAALGPGRTPATRLQIGSVKTNLGHLEAAAGVAGLIKVVLMLQHGLIPPHLHLTQLNPHVTWDEVPIDVPTGGAPWPATAGPRAAGVSSFGFSGTNAHVVLAAAPAPPPSDRGRSVQVLTLTARTPTALATLARQCARHLADHPALAPADVAYTLNVGRARLTHRLAVVGADLDELHAGLMAFVAGDECDRLAIGHVDGPQSPIVAFVFTGHGSQYAAMGKGLYQSEPVFRAALDRCDEVLRATLATSLQEVLGYTADRPADDRAGRLDDIAVAQPALVAVQIALAELWRSWGVQPAAVIGHSVGEYAAAIVAGVLSLEDGLRLIAARSRLLATLPPDGEMVAVMADEARVADLLTPWADRVTIAAINGPASVVISGAAAAIEPALAALTVAQIETRRLAIPVAAHSPQVDPILRAFGQVAAGVQYQPADLAVYSSLTGGRADSAELASADYWRRHLREPVRFATAAAALYDQGCRIFVEIGPHPTLLGMLRHHLPDEGAVWAASLRRRCDDTRQLLTSLGMLAAAGVPVDWAAVYRAEQRRRVPLPTYPFERQRYWVDDVAPPVCRPAGAHPLLGARLRSPAVQGAVYETRLSLAGLPYLADHRIFDALVLPSPAFLELVLAAARTHVGPGLRAVERFTIQEALVVPEAGERVVQVVLGEADEAGMPFQVFSAAAASDAWTLHVAGRVTTGTPATTGQLDRPSLEARCTEQITHDDYYADLARAGLAFGPDFQGLRLVRRRDGEALGLVALPAALAAEAVDYGIHPALLDACLHLLGAPLAWSPDAGAYLLIAIDRFQLHAPPGPRLWSHIRLPDQQPRDGELVTADVLLYDEADDLVAEAIGVHLRRARQPALARAAMTRVPDWLYEVAWQERPVAVLGGAGLASPLAIAAAVAPSIDRLEADHGLADALAVVPDLEALSAAYAMQALYQLGWRPVLRDRVTVATLADDLGVVRRHQRLLARLLAILADEGTVRWVDGAWEVVRPVPGQADLPDRVAALRRRYPTSSELALLERCGAHLADAARGAIDPAQVLFPDGSLALVEPLYGATPGARVANDLLAAAVRHALTAWPADRPLRVLEIGAGSGATTRAVLPLLPVGATEYWFTDVSPAFLSRAAAAWGDHPGVRCQLFDVERDPADQGLPVHGFDLVLAANVLHATADLGRTLSHVRRTLAPGGLFLALEGTRALRWVDLTFGLTDGWWRFSDPALRPDHPLLTVPRWRDVLQAGGFVEVTALPHARGSQAVLLAQAPPAERAWRDDEWLIFADRRGVGAALAAALADAGAGCTLVVAGPGPVQLDDARWQAPAEPAAIAALMERLNPRGRVIYLWGLDGDAATVSAELLLIEQERATGGALALAQALVGRPARLWLVTCGAQPAGPLPHPAGVGQAALWGLGRVLALEHPEHWGGLVDLAPEDWGASGARALLTELAHADGEDQIAMRGASRLAPRLVRTAPLLGRGPSVTADAAYLITGGLGGLGLKLARWLAEGGARHLVLVGRQALPPRPAWATLVPASREAEQVAAIVALEALGARVTLVAADVADRAAMTALFARFGAELPPLRGVFHAAADLSSSPIRSLTPALLRAALRPKLAGGWLLHELTRDLALDAFVLFSSTTALWGARDLAHYAAANQTLDALAHYRRGLGLPALSVNWGTWDAMRVASTAEQQVVASHGLGRMPGDQALAALGALLAGDRPQVAVAAVDWRVLKPAYEARRPRPLLASMSAPDPAPPPPDRAPPTATAPTLMSQLASAPPETHRALIAAFVRAAVARALGVDRPADIDERQGLFEMGMDSLMAVELKGRLERGLHRPLPSTLTFNYPSVLDLTDYLVSEVGGGAGAGTAASATLVAAPVMPAPADDLSEDDLAALLSAKLARLSEQGT